MSRGHEQINNQYIKGMTETQFLSSQQTAEYLGISIWQVYKLHLSGKVPASKPNGGKIYFNKSDIDEWLVAGLKPTENDINKRATNTLLKTYTK